MKIDVCHTVLVLTFILKDPVALGKTVPEMVQFFLPSPLTATCSRGHHQEENFMANFGGITILISLNPLLLKYLLHMRYALGVLECECIFYEHLPFPYNTGLGIQNICTNITICGNILEYHQQNFTTNNPSQLCSFIRFFESSSRPNCPQLESLELYRRY